MKDEKVAVNDRDDANQAFPPWTNEEFLTVLDDAFGMLNDFWDWNERKLAREGNSPRSYKANTP